MAKWHTPASIRAEWADAPKDEATLQNLLDTAQDECILWANSSTYHSDPLDPDIEIPAGWREAHKLQTRAIWNFMQSNQQEDAAALLVGVGGVRVYPMDRNVKQRLRPDSPAPDRLIG